ncbi:hypothetical protein [Xanthomonas arboricola]|uniref:hypothetical protein n=1 Tax=Xanthomonas arboricola TaxID=56448 RepID=UPI0015E2B525|nr:hypothetical protein [Xanthomonas arboricola]
MAKGEIDIRMDFKLPNRLGKDLGIERKQLFMMSELLPEQERRPALIEVAHALQKRG